MLRSYLLVAENGQNSKPIYSLATLQPSSLKDFFDNIGELVEGFGQIKTQRSKYWGMKILECTK